MVMETIDRLSTYILVYVDNYQNNIYVEEIMILFLYRIEFFANLQQEFNLQLASISIRQHNVILTCSRSEAETKRNTCNNFKILSYMSHW